jgi:hypothetical protein
MMVSFSLLMKVGRIVLAGGILEGPGAQKCAGGGAIAHQGNIEESLNGPFSSLSNNNSQTKK